MTHLLGQQVQTVQSALQHRLLQFLHLTDQQDQWGQWVRTDQQVQLGLGDQLDQKDQSSQ